MCVASTCGLCIYANDQWVCEYKRDAGKRIIIKSNCTDKSKTTVNIQQQHAACYFERNALLRNDVFDCKTD